MANAGMSDDQLFELLQAWDEVSSAIDKVVTSLPGQLSATSENLERRRGNMRVVINRVTRARP